MDCRCQTVSCAVGRTRSHVEEGNRRCNWAGTARARLSRHPRIDRVFSMSREARHGKDTVGVRTSGGRGSRIA